MRNIQILLRQHVGAPCEAIVKAGDAVKKGTLIATPTGLGANIFSSVYGVVEEVLEDRIVIKPDAEQPEEFVEIKEGDKLEMVKEAGIVGMGGAGFPTSVKIGTDLNGGYVLVNAAECEPGLRHNMAQLEEQTDITIRGLKYCMEICNAGKGIIAIKKKNEKAVEAVRAAIKDEDNIFIHLMPDIYPMGEERAVVRECLDVLLETTQLPSAANAVVINCETLLRIAEAIELRKPSFSKHLTVIGKLNDGRAPHVYFDMPVGMAVEDLIEMSSGIEEPYGEIIMGGPFTGKSTTLESPITKTTGGIIVTVEFPDLHGAPVGLLVCACGGSEDRMREICEKMNGKVVSVAACKQAVAAKPGAPLKCENPGNCPGQAQKVLQFKKDGAEYTIIGNCSDCSNTVMGSAPQMKLKVFHQTDHVMRTIGHPLYRRLTISKQVEQLPNGK
ncbi:MAG: proline reductase-associated electron transfer protein PrdC [Eubacteriales bacterium]|nr:proline reductase-associated electron transfer protein PrdC [Eubacteriales bacterium]MDY3333112.1 proline reductase-associated electron transfer protein PrdC [Gallibacter sp.]